MYVYLYLYIYIHICICISILHILICVCIIFENTIIYLLCGNKIFEHVAIGTHRNKSCRTLKCSMPYSQLSFLAHMNVSCLSHL